METFHKFLSQVYVLPTIYVHIVAEFGENRPLLSCRKVVWYRPKLIGAVSENEIIKINLLLHAFPVVTAKERNVISIAFRHRSVHDGHNIIVEVLQVNGLDGTC